jgi:hypothetical protein
MGYSFFLFAKLHECTFGVSEEPYDAQYEELYVAYNRYKASPYNDPDFGEYSCMVDYLQDWKFRIEHFNQHK